jgi:hypothetical protein
VRKWGVGTWSRKQAKAGEELGAGVRGLVCTISALHPARATGHLLMPRATSCTASRPSHNAAELCSRRSMPSHIAIIALPGRREEDSVTTETHAALTCFLCHCHCPCPCRPPALHTRSKPTGNASRDGVSVVGVGGAPGNTPQHWHVQVTGVKAERAHVGDKGGLLAGV